SISLWFSNPVTRSRWMLRHLLVLWNGRWENFAFARGILLHLSGIPAPQTQVRLQMSILSHLRSSEHFFCATPKAVSRWLVWTKRFTLETHGSALQSQPRPNSCKRLTKRRLFARAAVAALEQSALAGGTPPAVRCQDRQAACRGLRRCVKPLCT